MSDLPIPTEPTNFYLDWTFWSFVVAALALIISLLPQLRRIILQGKAKAELSNRIRVNHSVGNSILGLHLSLSNSGSREIQVRAIKLEVSRDANHLMSILAPEYFEKPTDQNSVLFVPFSLREGANWSHWVNFYTYLDRRIDQYFRQHKTALVEHINSQRREMGDNTASAIQADISLVAPFMKIFDSQFKWESGEYEMSLIVDCVPRGANWSKTYRFTLYESDAQELRSYTDDYVFGAGIYFPAETHQDLFIPINEK